MLMQDTYRSPSCSGYEIVDQSLGRDNSRAGCHFSNRRLGLAHDMQYLDAVGQEIIGDDAAVAAPPNRFGAEHGAAVVFRQLLQSFQAVTEVLRQRIIGIGAKRLVSPEAVR